MYLYFLDIEKNVSNICKTERKESEVQLQVILLGWRETEIHLLPTTPHCGFRLRFALSILILIPPNSWIRRLCYNKPSKTCLHIAPTVSSNFQEDAALQSVLKLHHFHDVLSQNILCSLLIESKHTLHSGSVWHQATGSTCFTCFWKLLCTRYYKDRESSLHNSKTTQLLKHQYVLLIRICEGATTQLNCWGPK